MKHAYVSVVLPVATMPSSAALASLDAALGRAARTHELIVVTSYDGHNAGGDALQLSGPLSVVRTHARATRDGAVIAGLARAVGDFVVEWHGPLELLDAETLAALLGPTDSGAELVETPVAESSVVSRSFYRLANALRPSAVPVQKATGRSYSRNALGQVLAATGYESQLNVLVAELPLEKARTPTGYPLAHGASLRQRLSDGVTLLAKGTRFGTAVPLALSGLSASFGLVVALYALAIFLIRGRTPEGWTTLMVVTGLGQGAILAMLGLTWTRIDALTRGLSHNHDATAVVTVIAPSGKQETRLTTPADVRSASPDLHASARTETACGAIELSQGSVQSTATSTSSFGGPP